jgi:phage terminase large subunit GpA-like protein
MDAAFAAAVKPDPDLTLSQWADQYSVLSCVSAGKPSRWRTSARHSCAKSWTASAPCRCSRAQNFMKPAQIGGSEVLLNMLGYIVH